MSNKKTNLAARILAGALALVMILGAVYSAIAYLL